MEMMLRSDAGLSFARLAKCLALGDGNVGDASKIADVKFKSDPQLHRLLKAAVAAGARASGNWAANLTADEASPFTDFARFLRPSTIVGKFGLRGIPPLRRAPFRTPLLSQTDGGSGYWVGEGKPAPATHAGFTRDSLTPEKVGNIAVLTEEVLKADAPANEFVIRDALRDALIERMDRDFIDPTNAGVANVKPASVTNGAATVASTGTDADAVRMDVRALFAKFDDADNAPETGVWIMSTKNAIALSLMTNVLDGAAFPGVSARGGYFLGLPVITSRYAGDVVALVNADDLFLADDEQTEVILATDATVELLDAALAQNANTGAGAQQVSLWQSNLIGFRALRTINWKRRRDSAAAYLTGVAWGGTVPAS